MRRNHFIVIHVKSMTREQLEGRKAKAARFLRDVLQDDYRAAEVEDESLDSYAERRRIRLLNPSISKGKSVMATVENKADLKRRIRELEDENDELQTKLDDIADLVMPEEGEDGEGDEVEEDEEEERRP